MVEPHVKLSSANSVSRARRNRAERLRKMAANNPKRHAAKLKERQRRQKQLEYIRDQKECIRLEKKRIRDSLRQQRLKIAEEKRNILRLKRVKRTTIQCSSEKTSDLSLAMARLVPTSAEISNLSHAQYTKLRSDVSKVLSGIRLYAQKCNPGFSAKKKSKPVSQQALCALNLPVRQTFIPDIGVAVPDKVPVGEKAFQQARKRLGFNSWSPAAAGKNKKKKRIAPTLIRKNDNLWM